MSWAIAVAVNALVSEPSAKNGVRRHQVVLAQLADAGPLEVDHLVVPDDHGGDPGVRQVLRASSRMASKAAASGGAAARTAAAPERSRSAAQAPQCLRGVISDASGNRRPPLRVHALVALCYNAVMKRYSTQPTDSPRVTFWGAAQSVTGSMHLVEAAGRRILLDCGLVRGKRDEARQRNVRFPSPRRIDAVVLSHAHIDHCGNLPNLVSQGFAGPIYCTPATRDLTAVMLGDSARIREQEAVVAGVVHERRRPTRPCTRARTPTRCRLQCVAVPYETPHAIPRHPAALPRRRPHPRLGDGRADDRPAGGQVSRITFTGDLGRRGLPFLREPSAVPSADLLICESTYGGRVHEGMDRLAARMGDVVRRTLPAAARCWSRRSASAARRSSSITCAAGCATACCRSAAVRGQPAGRRHRGGVRSLWRSFRRRRRRRDAARHLRADGRGEQGAEPKSGAVHRGGVRRHVRRRPDHDLSASAHRRPAGDDRAGQLPGAAHAGPAAAGEAADGALPRPRTGTSGPRWWR